MAGQHHPQDARGRQPAPLPRGVLGDRADVEPDDLRRGDRQQRRLRRRYPRKGGCREIRRSVVHGAGAGRPTPRRRPVPADLRLHRRGRRLGFDGSVAAVGAGHGGQHRGGRADPCAGASTESVRQDPGYAGRHPRNRRIDLLRRADQRYPAVLARAVSRRRRGLSARHRTTHRRRARSASRSPRCSSAAGTRR